MYVPYPSEINATEMREMLDVNVVALVLCSKLSVQLMKNAGINDGHIFHIGR